MNFYPLIAGVPDSSRPGGVLKLMTDPKKFWGQWVLPTLPYDDPLWPTQDYWKGQGLGTRSITLFSRLKRYASHRIAGLFAAKFFGSSCETGQAETRLRRKLPEHIRRA